MHHHPPPGHPLGFLAILFLVSNLAIAAGYVAVPFFVLRYLRLRRSTLILGAGFFVGCAGTHVGMALMECRAAGWQWVLWHAFQAVFTWAFIIKFGNDLRMAKRLLAGVPRAVQQINDDAAGGA